MKSPNILLITTDEQRFDHIGIKGMAGVCTPNMDRLSQEGIAFDRAYTASPTCTPARVSILTGQYPSVHGAYTIGVSCNLDPQRTIAFWLKKPGYSTALFGKTHFVARSDEARHLAGTEETPDSDFFHKFTGPYMGFDYIQTCIGHTTNTKPDMHYRIFLENLGIDYKQWFPQLTGTDDQNEVGVWNIPEQYHDTHWVASKTTEWIRDKSNDDDPWFCWASFQDPHAPFICPDPYFSQVDMDGVELYEDYRDGEFDDKPGFYKNRYNNDWSEFEDSKGVPCAYAYKELKSAKKRRQALQATLGMLRFIDDRLGRIIKTLEETGQAENTVIIFTSDHGEYHGHHGFWYKGFPAYDDAQRIPFIVWGPGYVQPQGLSDSFASLVDVPGTILSLAGIEKPQGLQGYDLTDVLKGKTQNVRDCVRIENNATCKVFQETLVTDPYKLVIYRDSDDGELYNLKTDPDQYANLWSDERNQSVKLQLIQKLCQQKMKDIGHLPPRKAFA